MQQSEFMLNQRPGVTSARGAKAWLRELPLSDARSAHHAVVAMLSEWEETPTAPLARLEILETVRGHVAEIDAQYAARYAEKPLPLGIQERNAFQHAQVLWRSMAAAYLECFEASLEDAVDLAPHRALCLARAGAYFCQTLMGRLRSGQAQDADLCDDLEHLAELAAEHEVLDVIVRDSLHPRGCTNVAATYRRALFIAQVGSGVTGRTRQAMFELAHQWEGKSRFATPLQASGASATTLVDGERRRLRAFRFGQRRRVLDVTRLSRSIRRRLRKLEQGATFEDLRLPEAFRQLPVREVLTRLHALWCESAETRTESRMGGLPAGGAPAPQKLSVSFTQDGFESMYFMIAGEAFALGENDPTSRRRYDELFVFQGASQAREENRGLEAVRSFEDWEIIDQSASGFRLRRPSPGARFRPGQLMAMRLRLSGDDGPVVLAQVRHVTEPQPGAAQARPGTIEAGVELLKGKPHAIGVRATGLNAQNGGEFKAAFRLGSLFANETSCLALPVGWFKAERVVEIHDSGRNQRVRMVALLDRGVDFEHVEVALST